MTCSSTTSTNRNFLIVTLLAGVVIRLLWLVQVNGDLGGFAGSGEATRVAMAVAEGRGFADAYYPGSGPTAHFLPLMPAATALWMWLFGLDTPATNLCLLAFSLAQVGIAYFIFARLFERLDADPAAIRWSLVMLCLLPVFVQREVIDFRYWEGAAGLGLASGSLLLLAATGSAQAISLQRMMAASFLAALTFFVSPPVGLAVIACWGIFALRRLSFRRCLTFALTMLAALALFIAPWAIRNERQLGSPILLRSNAGLELALANHPQALSERSVEDIYIDRLMAIHPYHGTGARSNLSEAGGEVAYSARLGAATGEWIKAHPGDFARLSLDHLRQFYFPDAWVYERTESDGFNAARATMIALVNLVGLLALGAGLIFRRRGYWMIAVYLAGVSTTYMLVQPIPRYTYLAYVPLMFVAVDGAVRSFRFARGARNVAGFLPLDWRQAAFGRGTGSGSNS